MLPDTNNSFQAIMLSMRDFDLEQLQSFQRHVRNSLAERQPKASSQQLPHIDMAYLEFVKNVRSEQARLSFQTLLETVLTLPSEQLLILDILSVFLMHQMNLSAALPEIMERALITRDLGDATEIVLPAFGLVRKPADSLSQPE